MFANLVESSSHKRDYARSGKFFLGTLSIYALAFLAIGVGSIYAYNAQVENKNLELISLVTPVESAQVQPIRVRAASRPAGPSNNTSNTAVVRTPPTMVTNDSRLIPRGVNVSTPTTELPTGTIYKIGTPGPGDNIFGGPGSTGPSGPGGPGGGSKEMDELAKGTPPPPPPVKVETEKPKAPTIIRSKGPVNGQATYLPKPAFTAIARAAHAFGDVNVEVLIDENGKVVSARAVNGHPLLLTESVRAALQARFTPTTLGGQPVKVSGIITYHFVMQ